MQRLYTEALVSTFLKAKCQYYWFHDVHFASKILPKYSRLHR